MRETGGLLMSQPQHDDGLQAATEQVVALGAARAVGSVVREMARSEMIWLAFAGPASARASLALVATEALDRHEPLRETRGGETVWAMPFRDMTARRGATVALGSGALPWQLGLLGLLSEAACLTAALQAERQHAARLQEWLTATGRHVATGNAVAGVAHRINNPLTTIIGEAQLLQTEPFGPGVQASLSAIERAGQRIRAAVQAVVQFSHSDGLAESTDVNATIEAALGLVASQLEGAGVRLTARLAPNLPPVHANAAALTEAWVHLLVNAWQAIPREEVGEVRITTRLRQDTILVTVADNGPVAARRRRPVQPFAPEMRGGLFLAWDILTRAGGQVIVASRPGIGTTIGVRLPLKMALK